MGGCADCDGWEAPSTVTGPVGACSVARMASGVRRFLLNGSVIGSAARGWSLVKTTRHGPRDRRLAWQWAGWTLSSALIVVTLIWVPGKAWSVPFRLFRHR
jgi:hypothetical protein